MTQRIIIKGVIQEAVRKPLTDMRPKILEIAAIIKEADLDVADTLRFMETIILSELKNE